MRKILSLAFLIAFYSSPLSAATILVEDFEEPFVTWEGDWLGVNSNLENFYVSLNGSPNTFRGNNPDGLWVSDGDGTLTNDFLVNIAFSPAFAATLTTFDIDIAAHVSGVFRIYDSFGANLLTAAFGATGNALADPGGYTHFGVAAATGIGGFSFERTVADIEGNVGIDNVRVTVDGLTAVPEPASLLLLGGGVVGLGAKVRRRKKQNQ